MHQGRGLRFPCNDQTDEVNIISYLLYDLFSAEKRETFFNIRLRAQEVSQGHAIQTRRNGFFDNEAIFVFITPRSRANSTTLIFTNQTDLCLQVLDP